MFPSELSSFGVKSISNALKTKRDVVSRTKEPSENSYSAFVCLYVPIITQISQTRSKVKCARNSILLPKNAFFGKKDGPF